MKAWLKMFWFLRYSPTLNLMWCHVCRFYADESHHKCGLVKGSRQFKTLKIWQHSTSIYRQESEYRHRETTRLQMTGES